MKFENDNKSIILIILGLFFSQLLLVKYSLYGGFIFYEMKIQIGSIISYNGGTENRYLTTRFIGYMFFAIFAFLNHKNGLRHHINQFILIASVCAFMLEMKWIYNDLSNSYNGQSLQIGWVLFFGSLVIIRERMYDRK